MSQVLTAGFSFSAFEMTLAEGVKLEKKLFYSTFATVSSLSMLVMLLGVPRVLWKYTLGPDFF